MTWRCRPASRRSLFLQFAYREVGGAHAYVHNWHIDAIIHELGRVRSGDNRRLIVTMPPRHLKSVTISVAWVAWMLGHHPVLKFICVSYGQELADKHAGDCLKIMHTDWYRRTFPKLTLTKRAINDFETSVGGGRMSTSITGMNTGRGADIAIIDDPTKADEAMGETARTQASEWMENTMLQRLDDQQSGSLLLVTQISNRTGLVVPVREIVAMPARGVDTIVDAAHGVALLDFTLDDLAADFVGWSVHKWTSAPLGTGAMFVRRSRIADIEIAYDNSHLPIDSINAREPAGTINFAAVLTIPAAVDFHFAIGAKAKERHMRALRDRWARVAADLPHVTLAVPDEPQRYCAITSFRLSGMKTDAQATAVQRRLLDKHKILTVWRTGVAAGPVVRVTPGLYSTPADVDALAEALKVEQGMFL